MKSKISKIHGKDKKQQEANIEKYKNGNSPQKEENKGVSAQIKKLTIPAKGLYRLFNVMELNMSRLTKIPQYLQLIQEVEDFNEQIRQWREDKHEIKNMVVTYHLYENLFSRMKYITIFSKTFQDAVYSVSQTVRWFLQQKPKKRNFVPPTKPDLKTFIPDPSQETTLVDYVQTNQIKKQMQPYQIMSRTAQSQFFPPSERLQQYRRKQFAPITTHKNSSPNRNGSPVASAKIQSQKKFSAHKDSMATRSTFKQTISSFKMSDKKIDQVVDKLDDIIENRQIEQLEITDENKQKIVKQQQLIKEELKEQNLQEDQPDQRDQEDMVYSQEEEREIFKQKIKKFSKEPSQILIAQQKIKKPNQSTIRRILNNQQKNIQIKLEELDFKRNMINWGITKSNFNKQASIKAEKVTKGNNYPSLQYNLPPAINKIVKKPPVQVNFLYRSKSSHPGSIEKTINQVKVKNAIQKYGKYIKHQINKLQVENQYEQDLIVKYRGSSLTSHAERHPQKKYFGDIIMENNQQAYNEQARQKIHSIKMKLSGKNAAVSNECIYQSLSIPQKEDIRSLTMYKSGSNLLSNPFFPKHLYVDKPKKKKNK